MLQPSAPRRMGGPTAASTTSRQSQLGVPRPSSPARGPARPRGGGGGGGVGAGSQKANSAWLGLGPTRGATGGRRAGPGGGGGSPHPRRPRHRRTGLPGRERPTTEPSQQRPLRPALTVWATRLPREAPTSQDRQPHYTASQLHLNLNSSVPAVVLGQI